MNALGKSYDGEFDALNKLNEYTGIAVPKSLDGIEEKAVFHNVTVEKEDMMSFVSEMVNKKVWHN